MTMMTCTPPSGLVSDYLRDRAQCLVNVLALAKHKPESCQIGPDSTSYAQALRVVSDHIMRNSKKVAKYGFATTDSALHSIPAAENMVNSVGPFQLWTIVLRMRDFLQATASRLLTQPMGESNSFAISQAQAWKSLLEGEPWKELQQAMSPTEMKKLQGIFTDVLQHELGLLESALSKSGRGVPQAAKLENSKAPWHPSNIIFTTDYDVTCTVFDSCYFLLQDNEAFKPAMARYEEIQTTIYSSFESQEQDSDSSIYWREREQSQNKFLSGFDPSLQPVLKSLSDITTDLDEEISSPYNEAGLRKALVKLANVEEICNSDIMSVGFLKGAAREEIRERAKKVLIRPNCTQVLRQLSQVGSSVHVVSANWSRDVILGGLTDLPEEKLFLHCNELDFDSAGLAEGTFDNTCVDAFDKEKMLRLLRRLPSLTTASAEESGESTVETQKQNPNSNEQDDKMLVFLGDSPTDLLGLLEADLGIVFGESPRLRRLLSLYNVQLLPLVAATAHIIVARSSGSNWSCRRSGILFEARGWNDVEACLFGQVDVAEMNSALPLSSKIEKVIEDAQRQQQHPLEYDDWARDLLTPISLDMIRAIA